MSAARGAPQQHALELWAGAECTVNRVGDRYIDQNELTGHACRLTDLDRFAELGISAIRYPILWERTAPRGPEAGTWTWADERLGRLRELGIRPIVGLVHHGSGPPDTSLIDSAFPRRLASFARTVAERYPWVEAFTPVNEPLTTARFSGLYGHWYPHGRDDAIFVRALLTQCRAVVEAMNAIRAVTPHARLVQTDDLGKTSSTPTLRYQAELENDRRWLSFDLLTGRIDRDHPLWRWLIREGGAGEGDLEWFLEHPSPPDIVGINHYLSSERYLDEHLERYPDVCHGGNGRHRYADELTARIREAGPYGPQALFWEAWQRYRLPLALTEVHNGCTREEQMRWFLEVWSAAQNLREEGADICAVTAWSLLGARGWDRLVTDEGGRYEPGVFDLRGPDPRPTAMAPLLRTLSAGKRPEQPILQVPGWWRRPDRLTYGFAVSDSGDLHPVHALPSINDRYHTVPPLLITGATGTLGQATARVCERRGIPYRLLRRSQMDITDDASVSRALDGYMPWAVINTAGYVQVDEAELEPELCRHANSHGPAVLAAACARRGLPLVTFSSDLVFDGKQRHLYTECDPAAPLNVYGRSKWEAERRTLRAHPEALVIRTAAFFGPWDEHNAVTGTLSRLSAGEHVPAASDQIVSPTYLPDLVDAYLDLLIDGESGIWHLTNSGAMSWAELAANAAVLMGVPTRALQPVPTSALGLLAPRPPYSALGSVRGVLLPSIEDALARFSREVEMETTLVPG